MITRQLGGETFLSLNRKPLTMGLTDPFTLFGELSREIKALKSIEALLLPGQATSALQQLAAEQRQVAGGQLRVDGRSPLVHWLNNLEKDPQYMRWPKTVKALLQPNWPGQMYFVRKNLISLMFVLDPGTDEGLQMAAVAWQLLQQQMPIRVGIVPVLPADPNEPRVYEWSLEQLGLHQGQFQCPADPPARAAQDQSISEMVYRLYRFVRLKSDNITALRWLVHLFSSRNQMQTEAAPPPLNKADLEEAFLQFCSEALPELEADTELFAAQLTAKRFNQPVASASKYAAAKGFAQLPLALCNGRVIPAGGLQRQLMQVLMMEQRELQQLVQEELLDDETNIEDFVLAHHQALEHFHPDLLRTAPEMARLEAATTKPPETGVISLGHLTRSVLGESCYLGSQVGQVTVWLVLDLTTPAGVKMALAGTELIREHEPENTRLALLAGNTGAADSLLPRALAAAAELSVTYPNATGLAAGLLELADRNLSVPLVAVEKMAKLFVPEAADKLLEMAQDKPRWARLFERQQAMCSKLGLKPNSVLTNGRVVTGPVRGQDLFALASAELKLRASKLAEIMEEHTEHSWGKLGHQFAYGGTRWTAAKERFASDQLLLASAVYFRPAEEKTDSAMRAAYMPPAFEKDTPLLREISVSTSSANETDEAPLHIVAALDPLSQDAQRVAPVLLYLTKLFPVSVKLILYPPSSLSELPLHNFYRYVLPASQMQFGPDGAGLEQPRAVWDRLPEQQMLTLNLDTPGAWQMEPVTSGQDMDNIKLADAPSSSVFAKYRIAQLYVQGNAAELPSRQPPRGLQLALDSSGPDRAVVSDTIVMANLGYFQLKASPGLFALHMVDGRSTELYQMKGGEHLRNGSVPDELLLTVDSFTGLDVTLEVSKRPGREEDELLQVPETQGGVKMTQRRVQAQYEAAKSKAETTCHQAKAVTGAGAVQAASKLCLKVTKEAQKLADKLKTMVDGPEKGAKLDQEISLFQSLRAQLFGGEQEATMKAVAAASEAETIHVFSLASGHLYERFLRIMMLSVIKHTKSEVKFWFLKNFLSSRFTQFFLPKIAKKHNIKYELVTYRWPSWLHQQSERQRIIWGHKILFLDVLFPLSVKKVIYIDADQVVRGDLKQLWDLDLQGAPLAMTPMCDTRKEVEGFRFWKQGFWKSHLAGKPYHISALFVVDLEMWRASAAGDQFRVVYEQLSKDKNSLANLDQDLPNYAQHQVPIFSLPMEWLWCGSWCSQESKPKAQTIDLCNDPLKKTPKLEMARKILPEWEGLDQEGQLIEESED